VRAVKYHEYSSNGSRDTTENVVCSPKFIAFSWWRLQANFYRFDLTRGECQVCSFMKLPRMESDMQPKRNIILQVVVFPNYWPVATKFNTDFTACVGGRSMKFYKNTVVGVGILTRSTSFPNKMPLIIVWSSTFVTHAWKLRGMEFQENPSHGSRNTTEGVVLSPSKVPLIFNRSQTNLRNF